jgi:hypothetical protein
VVRAELVCSVFGVFFVVHARSLPQKANGTPHWRPVRGKITL